MSKRIYTGIIGVLSVLILKNAGNILMFRTHSSYSVHDSLALILCNTEQMYNCGFGNPWNQYSYNFLAVLLISAIFVYSNSYAYPDGFRTLSIFRFGSQKAYWFHTMKRNAKNILFAATVYMGIVLVLCFLNQFQYGFGTVAFVPYQHYILTYVLFWLKLMMCLFLIIIFAEVFTGRFPHVGIIGGIIIFIALLLSIDLFQKRVILVIGDWQTQIKVMIGMLFVSFVLLIYGKIVGLRI